MSRRFLLIIFSFILFHGAKSQGIDETHALAHELFDQQEYDSSVRLFRRVAFFGEDSLKALVYPYIARCYLLTGDYSQSIFFFELASNTTGSDSLFKEYTFSKALIYILINEFNYSLQELYSIDPGDSGYFIRKYHFYLGIIHLKQDDIPGSQLHFLSAAGGREEYNEIIKAYNSINLKRPRPVTARIFSILLPGLGQIYSGDRFNAANSFFLNASLATLMLRIAFKQTFLDALITIGPWFQRYYIGGFTRAEQIAINRRIDKREDLLQELYMIFEEDSF